MTEPQARARHTDPGTSHAAAESVREITDRQQAVLDLFGKYGPMTDEALLLRYKDLRHRANTTLPEQSDSGIRTRRSELVDRGDLYDTGERSIMRSGRRAIVWAAPLPLTPEEAEAITEFLNGGDLDGADHSHTIETSIFEGEQPALFEVPDEPQRDRRHYDPDLP